MSEEATTPDALESAGGFCDSIERRDFEAALTVYFDREHVFADLGLGGQAMSQVRRRGGR